MRFFFVSFLQALVRAVTRPRALIAAACLPLIALAFTLLVPEAELTAPVRVGVAADPETEFAQLLTEYGGSVMTFCFTDLETIEKNVSLSRWDCGLVVPGDLPERLKALDTDGVITLVTGPGSTVYPIVREAASACLARLVSPYITEDYLRFAGIDYAPSGYEYPRVDVSVRTVGGGEADAAGYAESLWSRLLTAALAAAASVYMLLVSTDLGQRLAAEPGKLRGRLRAKTLVLAPQVIAFSLPMLAGSALAALILGDFSMIPGLAGLLALLAALSLILSRSRAVSGALPVLVPFAPLAAFLAALLPGRRLLLPLAGTLLLLSLLLDIPRRKAKE